MSDNNHPKDNHYLAYGIGFGLILGSLVVVIFNMVIGIEMSMIFGIPMGAAIGMLLGTMVGMIMDSNKNKV
jgi:hypothetical protein